MTFDRQPDGTRAGGVAAEHGWVGDVRRQPRPLAERTFFHNGGGIAWAVPEGIRVAFTGEGEWKITLDVFRDLGLAFGAAMVMIYVILVDADRLVRRPAGRHAGHPADRAGRHAGLLAAQRAWPARPSAATPTRSSSPPRP